MKKIISMIMALTMIFALAMTASAEEVPITPGTITVENTVKNSTYMLYRVLDATVDPANTANVSYSINRLFVNFFFPGGTPNTEWLSTTANENSTVVTYNENRYYLNVTESNVEEFVKDLYDHIIAVLDDNVQHQTGFDSEFIARKTSTADGQEIVFDNLEYGYYIVLSNSGAICSIDTNNVDATVNEKNIHPEATKTVAKVVDGVVSEYGESVSITTGTPVRFKLQFKSNSNTRRVSMVDFYDQNYLEYTSHTVEMTTADGVTRTLNPNEYDFADDTNPEGEKFLTWIFEADLVEPNSIFTIYVDMIPKTTIPVDGTVNTLRTNFAKKQMPDSTATVYSSELEIYKYANETWSDKLAGAVFVLKNSDNPQKYAQFVEGVEGETYPTVNWVTNIDDATKFETNENGRAYIYGIANGTYYLEEIEAPAGYNKLTEDRQVNMKTSTVGGDQNKGVHITTEISNKSGALLPSTGGMGTTLFYILGSLMAVGALVVLVTNKRVRV